MTDDVLEQLESDASPEAARLFTDVAAAYLAAARAGGGAVSAGPPPHEMAGRFAEPLPAEGRPLAEVAARLARDVVEGANRLSHPMYMGHQVSAPLPAAVWAESVIAALNNSMAVAEMSPTGTPLERQVVRWLCDLAGFGARAGGTFTSGGTEATFTALLAARSRAIPDVWRRGVGASPPVVVCGEHAHYAVTRAAGAMGLGLDAVVAVESAPPAADGTRDYRMDAGRLAARLDALAAEGRAVMAVVATAGATATGAFDDLDAIGRLCEARGLWLHVDGAHGASALLSPEHRGRLRGIERARSIAWDPHKMLLLPLAAGTVLVRDERDLERAFAQRAPYLFHGDADGEDDGVDAESGRNWDTGVRTFLCSRRADAVKLWVVLQRHGAAGLGALYAGLCDVAAALHAQVVARPDFAALHAPASNILCFRWVGAAAGGGGPPDAVVDAVNRETRARYNRGGEGWITATVLDGRPVLRVTVMNPRTTPAHTARLLDGLARVAREVAAEAAAAGTPVGQS
jgi:L-2,4-diaminobutyrate decarboxylase